MSAKPFILSHSDEESQRMRELLPEETKNVMGGCQHGDCPNPGLPDDWWDNIKDSLTCYPTARIDDSGDF